MQTFKIYVYEIITAFALVGLSYVYFGNARLLPFAKAMLFILYVILAIATEAVIASSLRPEMRRAFVLNMLVAAIVFALGWTTDLSLKISLSVAISTLTLRMLVASVSLRASKVRVRRITAALVGTTLLAETFASLYGTGERIYYDYYFYPRVKEAYVMPICWQDVIGYGLFWVATVLAMYLSYRLLSYAARRDRVALR